MIRGSVPCAHSGSNVRDGRRAMTTARGETLVAAWRDVGGRADLRRGAERHDSTRRDDGPRSQLITERHTRGYPDTMRISHSRDGSPSVVPSHRLAHQ